jgi:hypothetical protein
MASLPVMIALTPASCIDVQYPCVGVGAAEHFGIKHAWQIEIGGELGFTLRFGDRVGTRDSLSYHGIVWEDIFFLGG